MDPCFDLLAHEWRDFRARVREIPVVPEGTPAELRAWLAERFDFAVPRPLPDVTRDVAEALRRWTLHATHPRYFGLFNPDVHEASVMADALAAIFNPQVGGWTHAPMANEMERRSLEWFMGTIGYDPATSYASYTSGGSEANHTAVLAALMRR